MKLRLLIILAFLFVAPVALAQKVKILGIAGQSSTILTSGISSINKAYKTFPLSTVTVYETGTTNLVSLWSDPTGSTVLANPFAADSLANFGFYLNPGKIVDIRFSGTGITAPFTLSWIAAPGALGQTTVACGGTADTALLIAANLAGGTVNIPHPLTCASNTTTISAHLDIQKGGLLKPISGQTVTLTGPQNDGVWQKFTNVTSGTISFSGNRSVPTFYPQWFGVTGNGSTDDTAAMQAFLAAMQNGFHATLTPGMNIKNTGLTLGPIAKFVLEGVSGNDTDTTNMAKFSYVGTNGGIHFHLTSSRACKFMNFGINDRAGALVTDGPDTSIWLDQDGSGNISTFDTFRGLTIDGPNRSGYKVFKIENTSGTNNEQHVIDNVKAISYGYFTGYGNEVGVAVSQGHGNVKETDIKDSAFLGFAKGIKGNGSFYSKNNAFTATAILFEGLFGDACSSIDDHTEGSTQVAVNLGSAAFTIISLRAEDLHGGQAASGTTSTAPIFAPGANSNVEVRGSVFASISGSFNGNFLLGTTSTGTLTWLRNTVTGISAADLLMGLYTFPYPTHDVGGRGLAVGGALILAKPETGLFGTAPSLIAGNTPKYSSRYSFNQGGATSVTDFTDGFDGQIIILEGDTLTTLVNGATIKTLSGANIKPWGTGRVVVLMLNGTAWEQLSGVSGLAQGEGAALTISSNTIVPTNQIHQVGAGLIKTITVPSSITSGAVQLVPTAAFTYDATGNVLGTGTAVVGRTMFATYSASTGKWSMSY